MESELLRTGGRMNIDETLVAGATKAAADACTRHVVCNEAITAAVEYALSQQPADALGGVRELVARCRAEADAAYVAYIRKMDTDECRGWEAKVRAGTFARANLDAFTAAAELLSRSRALHAFASRLEAALAAQQQGDKA